MKDLQQVQAKVHHRDVFCKTLLVGLVALLETHAHALMGCPVHKKNVKKMSKYYCRGITDPSKSITNIITLALYQTEMTKCFFQFLHKLTIQRIINIHTFVREIRLQ